MKRSSTCLLATLLMAAAAPARAADVPEQAGACLACHGADGRPSAPEIPILFGQQEGYLYVQLRDFKLGSRKSEAMGPVAAELSKDDMKALAAWLAAQPWPRLQQAASAADAAVGARANDAGMCTACHLGGFLGAGTAPRLAGQQQAYLAATLHAFKTKERANNPAMSDLMATFADADLAAIAGYLGSL